MYSNRYFSTFLFFILLACAPAFAEDFGIIMDIAGQAEANKKPLDLGKNIFVGDAITVSEKGSLLVIEYNGCVEWRVNGPAKVQVNKSGLQVAKGGNGLVQKGKKLPACFKPLEMRSASTHEQGSLVLMTNEQKSAGDLPSPPVPDTELSATAVADPLWVAQMRKDFKEGKAEVSELMTLIAYDMGKNDKESAKQYYLELMKKAPDSQYVKQLGNELN
jgi:hypothetical protein